MNSKPRFPAQPGFSTREFLLRPIQEADATSDYDAVMETRDFLRDWEGTGWPQDDFTVDENKEDVIRLERRHQNEESFTYTILNPNETRCLGCVYIFPTTAQLFVKAEIRSRSNTKWLDSTVAVYFWVRKSCMDEGLDTQLLRLLDRWLQQLWCLDDYLLITNERAHHQIVLFEGMGRTVRFELGYASKPTRELAF